MEKNEYGSQHVSLLLKLFNMKKFSKYILQLCAVSLTEKY